MSKDLITTVEHEGSKWALIKQGAEHKIKDRELAAHLKCKVGHLRQKVKEIVAENEGFRPEFKDSAHVENLDVVGHTKKPPSREKGTYLFTLEEALLVITRCATPVARERTRQMIAVFVMVARGEIPAPPADLSALTHAVTTLAQGMTALQQQMTVLMGQQRPAPLPAYPQMPAVSVPSGAEMARRADLAARLGLFMKQKAADQLPTLELTGAPEERKAARDAHKKQYSETIDANWRHLYSRFYIKTGKNLQQISKDRKLRSGVKAAEQIGLIDELYQLALSLYGAGGPP